jgi:hypothetical protein
MAGRCPGGSQVTRLALSREWRQHKATSRRGTVKDVAERIERRIGRDLTPAEYAALCSGSHPDTLRTRYLMLRGGDYRLVPFRCDTHRCLTIREAKP